VRSTGQNGKPKNPNLAEHTTLTPNEDIKHLFGWISRGTNNVEEGYRFVCTEVPVNSNINPLSSYDYGNSTEYAYYTDKEDFYQISPADIADKIGTEYTSDSYVIEEGNKVYVCLTKNPEYSKPQNPPQTSSPVVWWLRKKDFANKHFEL